MADWLYIGYCTVMAMFVVAAAYAAVVGLRALRRLPRSLLLGFATAAIVATLTAQKTNNVPPNMNQPQMMQGGVSQTGLTGLPFPVPHSPFPIANPVQNNILVQTTNADISRGWRVESVATNAAVSYVMPTNAMRVGNWHIHGASSSFGNNVVDFGVLRTSGTLVPTNWSFPLGTNDEAFSSFWYFIDGRLRPAPRDAVHEICAVAVPMSAVPGQSRLWRFDGEDGSRILTWENFFLGGDTNCPVNAQIVLSPNGDFITRSNDVETVCRRINPDDWDDDGIHNERDANPTVCDGDFFGPSNILPAGANTNAYYTISVVATGPDALVTFTGDKPCNYPDPRFVAKSGVTNEVVILIGKTYAISSDWPFAVVGVSDPETEVWQMRGAAHQTYACRPVTISASDGNPFTMSVVLDQWGRRHFRMELPDGLYMLRLHRRRTVFLRGLLASGDELPLRMLLRRNGPEVGPVFRASRCVCLCFVLEVGGHLRGRIRERAGTVGRQKLDADATQHRCQWRPGWRNALGNEHKHWQVEPYFRSRSSTCFCGSSRRDASFLLHRLRGGNGEHDG